MSLRELFVWPGALPILALAPLAWVALLVLDRARSRGVARVLGERGRSLAPEPTGGRRHLRSSIVAAGLLLALVAVLQPVWGEGSRRVEQRGVDVVVCLDVSRSMLARDVTPSRLERARSEILALADRARGDRLGLVAFAGEARRIVPLTQDMDSFAERVSLVDPLSVGRGGTDLGAALEAALGALQGSSGEHEVIVVITDGEDLAERGLRVAEQCKQKKITVHCVGVGSAVGSKIPVEGERGEVFLRDRSGNEVVSAMDSTSLRRIAEATGGEFVDGSGSPGSLVDLYEAHIAPMAQKTFEAEERRERKNRFQWPLLAAFLLWIVELSLNDRTRP
ncbi:MAG: VWA domain-containing protein [Planctomycetes bacterium]|nr:VWA domain-containing protein [Planctomycetota bacterium]